MKVLGKHMTHQEIAGDYGRSCVQSVSCRFYRSHVSFDGSHLLFLFPPFRLGLSDFCLCLSYPPSSPTPLPLLPLPLPLPFFLPVHLSSTLHDDYNDYDDKCIYIRKPHVFVPLLATTGSQGSLKGGDSHCSFRISNAFLKPVKHSQR